MKKRFLFSLLAIFLAGFGLGGVSMAAESIVDLNNQATWIIDREEPDNFTVANGKISFTVKETPAADAWNAWQGRGAYPDVSFDNTWAVEYTLDVTSEMLTTNNVNASMWIQVDKNGGNTAVSQTDCIDWSIIQFINNTTPKFQVWNANGGGWTDIAGINPEVGTYTIKTVFDNGVITQYINGEQVNTYNLEDTPTRPAYVIAQGRSYGASFSVEMGVPTITIPYELPADLTSQETWIIDREEPDNFTVANGKISFTVKETPAADAWNAWQGRGAYPNVSFDNTWAVEYTLDVTSEMLTTNNVNASMWIQVDKDGGNTAVSQTDCIDWSIIQFINNTTPKFQVWNANGGGWTDITGVNPEVGTYTIKTVFDNGVITQYINGEQVNTYNLENTATRPAYVIAQGRSYGASFSIEMGVPTITIPYEKILPELTTTITNGKVGVAQSFSFSTVANDYAGTNVVALSQFNDNAALESLYYVYEGQKIDILNGNGQFGADAGFPLANASSNFEVTFKTAGTYTFTVDLVDAANHDIKYATVEKTIIITNKSSGGGSSSSSSSNKTGDNNTGATTETGTTADTGADAPAAVDPQAVQENGYTNEMNEAYEFAYANGITTMKTIDEAEMFDGLTRIAMAKMLSQYAINVLKKTPADVEVPTFVDVSSDLDAEYANGVTLAYKLGIMGINMPDNKFLPYETVTRAQFGTALSRLLFGIEDGEDAYYTTHLAKLKEAGIITNDDPTLEELRGYVMLMLMRSSK